jgi:hypothetical protein
MTCFIVGDSIALGTATAEGLKPSHKPACNYDAKIGIPSAQVVGKVRTNDYARTADLVVVSAGSNDPYNPRLANNLQAIRDHLGHRVLWIVPVNPRAAMLVRIVAQHNGDGVVSFQPGHDGHHPHSYLPIINRINNELDDIERYHELRDRRTTALLKSQGETVQGTTPAPLSWWQRLLALLAKILERQ